ncbi:glycosyl hydrolase family 18 protein [Clostridiaceae bacterium M8S5]|nr:glycosyl hydrolase family 18 protein [Clostridiaceae bacterium M8S5]
MNKKIKLIIGFVFIIAGLAVGIRALFMELTNDAYAASYEETRISIDGKLIDDVGRAIVEEDNIYIPVDIFVKYLHQDSIVNEESKTLIVNFPNPKFTLPSKLSNKRIENGVSINFLLSNKEEINYIDILDMGKLLRIKMQYNQSRNVLNIDTNIQFTQTDKVDQPNQANQVGIINRNTSLRLTQSSFSEKIDTLSKGDKVTIFEEGEKWSKIKTQNGKVGFVIKSKIDRIGQDSQTGLDNEDTTDLNALNQKDNGGQLNQVGIINRNTSMRLKQSSFSERIDRLSKGDKVIIFEEGEKWSKVKNQNGKIGFVINSKIDKTGESGQTGIDNTDNTTNLNVLKQPYKPDGKIGLAWVQVSLNSPNLKEEEKIDGLDVVSPTWFAITDKTGYVKNKASFDYVKEAHKKGYKVWGLVSNSFNKDLTHEILINKKAQENVIKQLLVYASLYDLDGINIDFENVYYEDKALFTAFIKDMTTAFKESNLVVSIDMTVPEGSLTWSKFLDRKKIGQIVDYCMIMTYDEHWASSPKSGSVASIGWVKKGMQQTMELVPKEKLLVGIPFYTRVWEETTLKNGKVKVKAKSLSMQSVNDKIMQYSLTPKWLDDVGQYYVEYRENGKRYRIWIEDSKSIQLKAALVDEYGLAGVACWRKGFETPEVWGIIKKELKK